MLTSNELVAFVATADPAAAMMFYRDRLGLRLVAETPDALEFEAGERMLRITSVAAVAPHPFTVLGWKVPDIADEVLALAKRGIAFERFEGVEQDETGIWTAPGGALVAWFKDPDGNLLSLTQFPAQLGDAAAEPPT